MKKIIYYLGILFLIIVLILNIVFTAKIEPSEHVIISFNSIIYLIGVVSLGFFIFFISKIIDIKLSKESDKSNKNIKKYLLIAIVLAYFLFTILWVGFIRPGIGADQIHVANLAQTMNRGNLEEFFPNVTYAGISLWEYVERYTQQITLAFIYMIFFKIIHFDAVSILRGPNVLSAVFIVWGLYKIGDQLSKSYKINKVLLLVFITTFVALPMLTTFVYGDIPGLCFCIWSVYFIMKFIELKKIRYILISSLFMMIAYMMRMNSLIFVIATVIYLILNVFKDIKQKIKDKQIKDIWISIAIICMYLLIIMVPPRVITNYYINKYNFDKTKSYPTISWIYLAMEEGPRANGWYNGKIGEYGLHNPEKAREEYPEKIKERINYLIKNPGYTIDFYVKKIASMWSENTYSSVWYNLVDGKNIQDLEKPIEFYQKALIMTITTCSLIVLIQNRKKISLELLFLITIFVGGFSFHILWEAKSRYIIPYIVILMPVASITIENIKFNIKNILNNKEK